MITLVNFADQKFERQRKWNSISGKLIGGIDNVLEYGPQDLDENFRESNKNILQYDKGFGNYTWKPYIINKALNTVNFGDYLFYADSGSFFVKSLKPIIKILEESGESILCFNFPLIERQWTKRDTFLIMNCDSPEFTNTAQIMGGFILIKKDQSSIRFLTEFQKLSSDDRIISDNKNVMGLESYPEFISHRHDQSILSLLVKKRKKLVLNDPTDYGLFPRRIIHSEKYLSDSTIISTKNNIIKVTLLLCRKERPLIYLIKYLIRLVLFKLKLYK